MVNAPSLVASGRTRVRITSHVDKVHLTGTFLLLTIKFIAAADIGNRFIWKVFRTLSLSKPERIEVHLQVATVLPIMVFGFTGHFPVITNGRGIGNASNSRQDARNKVTLMM